MTLDDRSLRDALSNVIRGAILLVVLTIIRALAFKLPGVDAMLGPLNAGGYIYVAISAVIIGVLVKMFEPLRKLVGYYLANAAKVGKIPGRERFMPQVVALSGTVVIFVYILAIYKYLGPVLVILNEAFFHWRGMYKVVGLTTVAIGLVVLVRMWMQASPLIDLLTGKLTETTASATAQIVNVTCPSCRAANDRDAKFCLSCGTSLTAPPPAGACAKCGSPLIAAAKFCGNCGAASATPA
jgi:hypothetical protein